MMTWSIAKRLPLPGTESLRWGLAALVCFFGFLVLTFPYGPLQARLLQELRRTSGWEVQAADWSVSLPSTIEWKGIIVTGPAGIIPIAAVRASVGVFPAFTGRLALQYVIQQSGGSAAERGKAATATGSVTAASWSLQSPIAVKGHLQQIDLSAILKPYISRGTIQGDFSHRWDAIAGLNGEGTVQADITDFMSERITSGTVSIPSLTFSRIRLTLACRDTLCDITELKGDGIDGSFAIQGRITLQQPLSQSLLNLSVTVVPGAGFSQKAAGLSLPPLQPGTSVTFKLAGPIMSAKVTL
ncbi:MAG: type II secretion system protein GspN [Nitrospira sp.]|nr:type II secretion system protein GspN [Nitrospira sp.]